MVEVVGAKVKQSKDVHILANFQKALILQLRWFKIADEISSVALWWMIGSIFMKAARK